jgi:hypothetical protein
MNLRRLPRLSPVLLGALCAASGSFMALPVTASANHGQIAIIQDGRVLTDPMGTLEDMRTLGATTVRVFMFWDAVAPQPTAKQKPSFNASDPNAYPAGGWGPYDAVVQDAQKLGMRIDLVVTGGAPRWAEGSGMPAAGKNPYYAWKPVARDYGQFMQAVGKRYSGSFTPTDASSPLPAIGFWTIWNEPNFGEDLGPQAIDGSRVSIAPTYYRSLVDWGWSALHQTGHAHDKILIGGFAAQGRSLRPSRRFPQGLPGNYSQTKPLEYILTLYCLGSNFRPMTGRAAAVRGCPSTTAGRRKFRSRNPGLFSATGVADHPYTGNLSPVSKKGLQPTFAEFSQLGGLERRLDRANQAWGSRKRYLIYNDEFGYITHPPQISGYVSPAKAAFYLNWAEYLSWRNPRVASYAQYLLQDGSPPPGGFASGLRTFGNQPKASFYAFRLPIFSPNAHTRRGGSIMLWGDARPAHFMSLDGNAGQTVSIQFQAHDRGAFKTMRTVKVSGGGYFSVREGFPSSGHVRLAYTYPDVDPLLPSGMTGFTAHSRLLQVVVR